MISAILLQANQAATVVADTLNRAVSQLPVLTPPSEVSFSILDLVQKGGWIMLPIGLLSVITVYIFIERGDVAGIEGARRSLSDWLDWMGFVDAGAQARLDRFIERDDDLGARIKPIRPD